MNKSIETLVDDIYNLFNSGHICNPDNIDLFSKRLAEKVASKLKEATAPPKKTLRFSNIGTPCRRKLWYIINRPELGEVLKPYVKIKFLFGDILEELLLFLAKEAGHEVIEEQSKVSISEIEGTRDAIIDGQLTDVKSASSRSFEKFKQHGLTSSDQFGYLDQLGAYLEASRGDPKLKEKDVGSFLVIDKQFGHITLDTYPPKRDSYEEYINELKEVVAQPEVPDRDFEPVPIGKSGNLGLDTFCSYCEFKHTCYPELRTFLYSSGPEYLTEVVRLPKVMEIDKDNNIIHGTL